MDNRVNRKVAYIAVSLTLVAAACTGDSGASEEIDSAATTSPVVSTTTLPLASTNTTATSQPTTTAQGSTTTTSQQTTTTQQTATTEATTATLPPAIAVAAFAFASGTTPRIDVAVAVAESPTGPWIPAEFDDPTPTITAPKYWVQFTITNLDSLGTVTEVNISGEVPDGGPLGSDICSLDEPLGVAEQTTCVVGGAEGFDTDPAGAEHFFTAVGEGFRQGTADEVYFDPPIPDSVAYNDAPYGFVLVFGTTEGLRIDGESHSPDVDIDLDGVNLSLPVRVDCSDDFPSGVSATGGSPTAGEPPMVAFVMAEFDSDGSRLGSCSLIPQRPLTFVLDGGSDSSYVYNSG